MNTVYLNLYGNQYIPVNRLPFNIDILNYLVFAKSKKSYIRSNNAIIYTHLSNHIMDIWKSASIPTISKRHEIIKMKSLCCKYEKFKKLSMKDKSNTAKKLFEKSINTLFDIKKMVSYQILKKLFIKIIKSELEPS